MRSRWDEKFFGEKGKEQEEMNYKQISNTEDNEEYIVSIHFAMKQEN